MNRIYKYITFFLILTIIFSFFAACERGGIETSVETTESTNSETESQTVEEVKLSVEKKDYNEDFYMFLHTGFFEYYWVEDSGSDAMSEAIFARQQQVYDHLGVNLIGKSEKQHDAYGNTFMTAVKNKDASIDMMLSNPYMFIPAFITGGYLSDIGAIDGIDLNADYWHLDVMDQVAINDHYYLGHSDYLIPHTHVITYNKEMLDQYSDALDESIYDTVREYRWTIDKMISLAQLVYIDNNADGKTADDTFGITGVQWMPFVGFLQACNIQLVDSNERGEYQVSVYNELNRERTASLVEKLSALSKSEYAYFRYRTEPTETIRIYSGKTLMSLDETFALPKYLDYGVSFGVLPYPMFDEEQKTVGYRSLDWNGWICVPSYVKNMALVADTLETLAFYSKDVTITFYEKLLGKQVADAPDDRQMLDIVWDSICSDIGLTYSHIGGSLDQNLYMLPTVTQANSQEHLVSYVKGYEVSANKLLKKFVKDLENQ